MTNTIQFNKRQLRFQTMNSRNLRGTVPTGPLKGTLYVYGPRHDFVFKAEDGTLYSNELGFWAYGDWHFSDRPRFLNALVMLGIVTRAEAKEYVAAGRKHDEDRDTKRRIKSLRHEAAKLGMKVVKK